MDRSFYLTNGLVRLSLPLLSGVFAASAAAAAEAEKEKAASANHPPGFIKPEPDAVIRLWPGDAPGLVPGAKAETFVNERHANVSVPQLFVYLPPKEKSSGTALVICAGGGYGHLAMCLHVENVIKLLNDQGIAVFGLKYRTRYGDNDVVADALADGKRAVRIVRGKAKEWAIDPHRIGVQGYSAGANLALNLMGRFDDGDPQAADPIERVSCRPDFCALMCLWPNGRPIADYPLRKDAPPAFFAHAKDDKTAPIGFAREVDEKLRGLGVREEMLVVESGGHGAFHVGMVEGPGARWPEALLPWLAKVDMWRRSPAAR
jgi:acetyl esterase/lipase